MDSGSTGSARVQKGRVSAGQGAPQHFPTVQQDPDPVSHHHMSTWIHCKCTSPLCVTLFFLRLLSTIHAAVHNFTYTLPLHTCVSNVM